MIGYHYTTRENWRRIQKEGLVPQLVEKEEVYQQVWAATGNRLEPVKACWVWENKQVGTTVLGHIMMVHKHHPTENIFVELAVEFDMDKESWSLPSEKYGKQFIQLMHDGFVDLGEQKITYHKKEPVRLITEIIPPIRIHRLASYNYHHARNRFMKEHSIRLVDLLD